MKAFRPAIPDGPPANSRDSKPWSIWILAGGRSSRMGRDKSRLSVGGRSLLRRVREVAAATGLPVRTIRRDFQPGNGPLGGMATGLRRAGVGWCLFLTCDMPLISVRLLNEAMMLAQRANRPVFLRTADGFGFPAALPVDAVAGLEAALTGGRRSLQSLADAVGASPLELPPDRARESFNVNTPADLFELRRIVDGGKNPKRPQN